MANVLSEVIDEGLTRGDIERRVADWRTRIGDLYAELVSWLPYGWTGVRRPGRWMDEELMREFGVPAIELPVLSMEGPTSRKVVVEPRGLWIVGANGRLDLTGEHGHFVITDAADNFAPPEWKISPLSDRRRLRPLDAAAFEEAL